MNELEWTNEDDRAYCSKCAYRSRNLSKQTCDYILITGKRRGCQAGHGCTKREIGGRKTGLRTEFNGEREFDAARLRKSDQITSYFSDVNKRLMKKDKKKPKEY